MISSTVMARSLAYRIFIHLFRFAHERRGDWLRLTNRLRHDSRATRRKATDEPRMSQYRNHLPQLDGRLFLTDGGIETSLIFHDGFELPYFAAFDLLRRPEGRAALKAYYERYLAIATADEVGFILESPTWRASADWADKLWLSCDELTAANWAAIDLMAELRAVHETETTPIVVSGCVGPRGDGYDPGQVMSPEAAAEYHADQVRVFAEAGADMATAITMTHVNEAVGVTRALVARFPHLNVRGGCCGTDHRHVQEISTACRARHRAAA